MGNQQCVLHCQILFVPPWKPGCTPEYPINPTHEEISISGQQYQNNLHAYHLVNNMNSSLKKIVVTAINEQWLKGANKLLMGYADKTFLEQMDWLYIHYGKIMPRDLIKNQDMMPTLYHVEEPIEILFDQIETGQECLITVNFPFSNRQLAGMGIT